MSKDPAHPETRDCREIIEDKSRGKLVFDRRGITSHPLAFLKILGPLFLSHHPSCSEYEHHTVDIRGRRFCIGCFFNTAFFFLASLVLFALWLFDQSLLNRSWLLYGGTGGVVLYLVVSLLHLSESTRKKIATKFLLGSSFSAIFILVVTAGGSIEFMIQEKYILVFALYLVVFTFLLVKRAHEFLKICEPCEYKMRWSRCPGFIDTVCELIDRRFVVPRETENKMDST
ncbi:MAG: hypothetical protein P1Q69_05350 [Candidatus Thorarchaeota archaeon]|nr:hypothetical protein [Candidatus Thorarchaeota archaeon]